MSSPSRVRNFLPATLSAALLIGLVTSQATASAAPRKPNFIVVFCDNLGYGDVEPFGSTLHRTPNLNRMAKEGRKFTHFCVTAGVCTPSRASLMTGCYSQRVGMHFNERDGWVLRPVSRYGLAPDEKTIAEVLKKQGYATAIVGKWHLGDQPEFLPTRQGFDWFFGVPYSDDMTERVWKKDGSKWPPLPLMENEDVIEAPCDRNGLTKRYTERAMEWIAKHKDEPFFLYFPQAMPGSTSTPFSSPEFKGKSRNGPWGDAIEELDWSMGVMLDQLRKLGIAEDTLVIWTSDNGAPINREPNNFRRGSNRPLHGRGYTTSEGAFRVPTLVWQPGKVPAGTVCHELATTMDLLPTFAKLAGANQSEIQKPDGHDVSSLMFKNDSTKTPYEGFYYYHQEQLQAVRSGPWKLFLPVTPVGAHPHFNAKRKPQNLLFHLVNDVACANNLAGEHPDVVARLSKIAEEARKDLGDKDRRGSGQRKRGKIERDPQPLLLKKEYEFPLLSDAFRKVIFPQGDGGSKYFRIPAIITAKNGDLLAVIDARRNTTRDLQHTRNIDIAFKRSSDNGATWSEIEFITKFPDGQVGSDASLVVDRKTGRIFCFYNYLDHDTKFNKERPSRTAVDYRYYLQTSDDHGKTWSEPEDIRDQILPSHLTRRDFVFVTSGRGTQTRSGLIIHTVAHVGKAGYLFGSSDQGKTWGALKKASPFAPANESKFIELSDGTWMINARVNGAGYRYVHRSTDQGKTWVSKKETSLPDPGCNAEPLVYTSKKDGYAKDRLLFVNSHSQKGRKNLVLSLSYDHGETWAHKKCLEKGPAAYSAITACRNGDIGIFFENGTKMTFLRVTLKDLTDGKDKLSKPYQIQ